MSRPDRRSLLGGAVALAAGYARAGDGPLRLTLRNDRPGGAISPLIYGSNEIGSMDGGAFSVDLDRLAGVTARRLGGDLMSGYNWMTNAAHAGKNYRHSNGAFLPEALGLPRERWHEPASVITATHDASLAMGAKTLLTVPLCGFVAADFGGPVAPEEAAPSRRFLPVDWEPGRAAGDAIDPMACNVPHLIARLVARYGPARSGTGIYGYALDNEPELWFETHPRLVPARLTVRQMLARSIAAARIIKTLDPSARVFGPVSWGATGMVSFQDAPDWPDFSRHGNFLAVYLDAFRRASEESGVRLLDALDVHWYPFHEVGKLFRSEDPARDTALLDAPRSLTETGFVEESWVPRALRSSTRSGLGLPILPSLSGLVRTWFPGTEIAITEFNYGGAGRLASGLALADALGRFGSAGVAFASHWGSLDGWLGVAYRLYRQADSRGFAFGGQSVPVEGVSPSLAAHAAMAGSGSRVVLINKAPSPVSVDIHFAGARPLQSLEVRGFDSENRDVVPLKDDAMPGADGGWRFTLPALSARRYDFT